MEKDMNKEKLEMLIRDTEFAVEQVGYAARWYADGEFQAKDSAVYVRKILEAAKLAALRVEVLANEFKKECEE